ncbi:MAG: hypothetical protein HFH60_12755 [Lachnospiraceae bacterium]|nr:hypothetical protein [Lachnospiraceae bacterium]
MATKWLVLPQVAKHHRHKRRRSSTHVWNGTHSYHMTNAAGRNMGIPNHGTKRQQDTVGTPKADALLLPPPLNRQRQP